MAQKRLLGGLRVAWVSVLAASCLTLDAAGPWHGAGRPTATGLAAGPHHRDPRRVSIVPRRVVSWRPHGSERVPSALAGARRGSALRGDGQRHRRRVRQLAVSGRDGPLHPRRGRARNPRVQRAWLDAVQPGIALDNQNTPAFFRAVREANAKRPVAEKTASCSVTRRSTGRTSGARLTTASGKSSAIPIRPTWSGGSCSRTIGGR